MTINQYSPSEPLKPFIKVYKVIESDEEITNRVLPSTSFVLAIRFRGNISYVNDSNKVALPLCTLSGLRKTVRFIQYAPSSACIVVLFTELGASLFFREPLDDFFEQSISLDYVLPTHEVAELIEQIDGACDTKERIDAVDAFLLSKLVHSKQDMLVSQAIKDIHAERGILSINSLAASLAISQDVLEKRFRKATGATPKQFASIVRMDNLIRHVAKQPSILDKVFEGGYYDQAHFSKEFKVFTGLTPKHFFQSAVFW
ncbi:MAG: helix-turn-helix domain-containing protein [Cyclobacteriaceae bacterium]|nr:helix-turn-helix domain-containing protein [Cyclobacteriaceae bacterium]